MRFKNADEIVYALEQAGFDSIKSGTHKNPLMPTSHIYYPKDFEKFLPNAEEAIYAEVLTLRLHGTEEIHLFFWPSADVPIPSSQVIKSHSSGRTRTIKTWCGTRIIYEKTEEGLMKSLSNRVEETWAYQNKIGKVVE